MTTFSTSEAEQEPTSRRSARAPNLTSSDPYAVLGLVRGASPREIKRAYFDLVRQYAPEEHPDAFKLIRAAYEKLRTSDVKAETDLFLFQPPPPWEPRKRRRKLDLAIHLEDIWMLLQEHGDLGRTDFTADHRPIRL
ncbi:MAG: J domain-containing protein [Chloroflexi bacterium]|nr:J domain-containing protein [Chloroflexota bacterium]